MRNVKVLLAVAAASVSSVVALVSAGNAPEHAGDDPLVRAGLPSDHAGSTADDALRAFGELPLAFVENRGQVDERVRFHLQGSRAAFFLTLEGIVVSIADDGASAGAGPRASAAQRVAHSAAETSAGTRRSAVSLALRFVGASPTVVVEGQEPAPGRVNFLRGADPAGWQTDVPRYGQVLYRDLWPGIDLAVRARGAELKYEFLVRPGARPSDIRLAYAGAERVTLEADGALAIDTAVGRVRDSAPVSWHVVGGERVPVESRYALPDGGDPARPYGFEVGAYDPAQTLVIDPGLDYSTYLGGSSMDRAGGVAVDAQGNAYVVGSTQSTDFPTTTGAFDRTFNGGLTDVFVAKLNAAGSALVYATYIGGSPTPLRRGGGDNLEFGRAIAVDGGGHAYVTGVTDSSNFPTTGGAFQPALKIDDPAAPNMATDAFVAKLNPSGSGFVYSTFFGGSGYDDGWSIAVDAQGNAHVTGDTDSSDLPVTPGAAQSGRGGGRDAFAVKLNASGSGIVYSTHLGGSDNEVGNGIAVDSAGNAYVVGGTRSADFRTTSGAFQPTHGGGAFDALFDAFVTKLDGAGALVYSTFLGGTRIDIASDVAVDGGGHAYVVGSSSSPEFPTTPGAFDRTSGGSFVTKLAPDGSSLVFSTFLGRGGSSAIALDAAGNAWVTGSAGAGAPTTDDAFAQENSGGADAWLGQLSADGAEILFATFLGGSNSDNGVDLALDGAGAVYVAGTTISFDFPTTTGAFDGTFAGDPLIFWGDAFVAKFGEGTGTTNPPTTRTTSEFSGTLDRNQTGLHTIQVGSPGEVDLHLDWNDSRATLTLRVRDGSGNQVFFDGSGAKPKSGSFTAANAGSYRIEVSNTSRRRTSYSLSVTYPFANSFPAAVTLLTLDPTTVSGGTSSTGRVALTAGAPAGGAVVALSSSNTAAATVPPSVTVPAGQTSATFVVSTSPVDANTTATITATYSGTSRSATLGVNAAGGIAMSTLTLQPTSVQGGGTSTGTATLTGPAPSGGAAVTLVSSNTAVAAVPPSVTVPAGQASVTFTVSTSPQQFNQSSAISASHGGVTRTVILSVTAGSAPTVSGLTLDPGSVTGGTSSTGRVTLSAAAPLGGATVALSSSNTAAATVPSSVTVPGGNTSATFTVTTSSVSANTSSTITATYNGTSRSAALAVNAASGGSEPPPEQTATLTVTATGRSGERVQSSPSGINVSVGTTGSATFVVGTSITLSVTNGRDAIWSGACSSGGTKRRTCSFTLTGNASVTANVQ